MNVRLSQAKLSEETWQIKNVQAAEDIQCITKERDKVCSEAEKEKAKFMVCLFPVKIT